MKNITIVLVLTLSAVAAFAQCGSKRITVRQEKHAASAVIVGTVLAAKPVPESWDFLDGVNYIVRVDAVIHGKTKRDQYTVFSENSPSFYGMTIGRHYVMYLSPHYDRYEINNCGNSHEIEEMMASTRQFARGY